MLILSFSLFFSFFRAARATIFGQRPRRFAATPLAKNRGARGAKERKKKKEKKIILTYPQDPLYECYKELIKKEIKILAPSMRKKRKKERNAMRESRGRGRREDEKRVHDNKARGQENHKRENQEKEKRKWRRQKTKPESKRKTGEKTKKKNNASGDARILWHRTLPHALRQQFKRKSYQKTRRRRENQNKITISRRRREKKQVFYDIRRAQAASRAYGG